MKAQELRIGNCIYYGESTRVITGLLNSPQRQGVWVDNLLTTLDTINPIPLTPEILEKCGFTFRSINDFYFADYGRYVYNMKTKQFFISKDDENDKDFVIVTSLHQLQNLYFSLTGEELPIKL